MTKPPERKNGENKTWTLTREKILMVSGLVLIAASFIVTEILGGPFHVEFLIAGLALCGISITQWKDKS